MIKYEKLSYLKFYQLSQWSSIHNHQLVIHNHHRIFTQSFIPYKRKGLVLIIHGYLDHSGSFSHLINSLLLDYYGVITFDLPGHRHSFGERGAINNFDEYIDILHSVLENYKSIGYNDETWSVIGHSTGCAILFSYLQVHQNVFDKMILAAPLVQPYLWSFSKIGVKLMGRKQKYIKRVYRRNSSDKNYLHFVRKDPLHFSTLPTNWLFAFSEWHNNTLFKIRGNETLYVIQGNKDTTVDWRHNIPFLLNRFPNSTCTLIDQANHQLFNEREALREISFHLIKRILKME
ncbi:alpha/beta hydrolase [Sutcliffiella rhizosphaerae]|uniref:Serine aminopeptidase S33 domain-containing protein n=1 Tax=Sutcliffiella rhizosphaerae TaxID=2880967 RepID=A0ABM8YNW8_9BACI|nr:alpha/beta hydrolase [Sutcliffiella rhizosphaerae]CAG9621689.1 hypothetical protein BACCIP111883_02462 [Sutcliffiella rhizosphaerae]